MLRTILSGSVVCAVLGIGSVLASISQHLNDPWVDILQRSLPRLQADSPVLLVEADRPAGHVAEDIEAATNHLRAAGARRIGLLADPGATPVFRALAERHDRVTAAWPVQPADAPGRRWQRPAAAPPDAPVYTLPADAGRPHRRHPLTLPTDSGRALTLEAALAGIADTARGVYTVDYRGGLARLPSAGLARAARGDLLPGMVDGRTVLIAGADRWPRPRYAAPVEGGLSAPQIHAFALRTLLDARPLTHLPWWAAGLVLLVGGAAAGALAAASSGRVYPWVVPGTLVTAAALSAGLMTATGVILPAGELALAVVALPALVFFRRERLEDALLERLAGAAAARARQADRSAGGDADAWTLVSRLVSESLHLDQTVFLAFDPESRRVRTVAATGTDVHTFVERRRDVTRPPFTDATEANTPVELTRQVIADEGGQNRQYLVRLDFGGRTMGYWAFTIQRSQDADTEETLAAAPVFAERVAELLYLDQSVRPGRRGWIFAHGARKTLSDELAQSLTATERRIGLYESVLGGIDVAVAVYDAFGRPMHVNRAMTALAQEGAIAPYAATATDLLSSLGGLERARARRLHRQAVMQGTSVSVPIEREIASKRYLLSVSPVHLPETSAASLFDETNTAQQRTDGVLITFSDYTSAANVFRLTESVGRFINTRLRNDLQNIMLAGDMLGRPELADPQRERALEMLKRAMQRADDELDQLHQQLSQEASAASTSFHPLDAAMVLQQALRTVAPRAAERRVDLRTHVSSFITPALGAPQALQEIFRAAAELVVDAAQPGSHVDVVYREDTRTVEIVFAAAGYGIPDERLQAMLERADRNEPDAATGLRNGRRSIRKWGGDLTARSDLGEGVVLTIRLCRAVRAGEGPAGAADTREK